MRKVIYSALLALLATTLVVAQDAKKYIKEGNDNLEYDHFRKAAKAFEKALAEEPENAEALFNLGRAYIGSFRHQEGLEKMQAALEIKPVIDKHQDYWLGRAYHLNYYFGDAVKYYSAYLSTIKSSKDTRKTDLEKFIKECGFGKQYLAQQSHYKITNVGAPINTEDIEHSPIISQDGKTMMFTSRHYFENGTGENHDDEFKEQILISKKDEEGKWTTPTEFSHNLNGHDATVQLFDGDSKLLMYRNSGAGDLYIAESNGDEWLEPEPFNEVNTQWSELDGYINADGNMMVFSSSFQSDNHDGSMDLYVITKDAKGKWSSPKSIGSNINSPYDENAPFISTDGKVLFFSSNGHSSMGGYDVFKCLYDESTESWSDPINLGYPLNTPGDDIYFYYSNANNWSGYFASYRRDGLGEKDIYEVTFIPNVFVKGVVMDTDKQQVVENVIVEFIAKGEADAMAKDLVEASENGKYLVNVLADHSYSVLIKTPEGQTLASFEYVIPSLKEGDKLEYVFDIKVNATTPELITENVTTAEANEEEDEKPVSIAMEEETTYDSPQTENSAETKQNTAIGSTKPGVANSLVDNSTSKTLANTSPKPTDVAANQTKNNATNSPNSNVSKDNSSTNSPSNSNDKIAVKEYFKMNDIETGCKRVLHHVYFDFNKATLKPESHEELSKLSCLMSTVPNIKVEIGGHTDGVGGNGYNKSLSQKRAESVVAFLISQGVDKTRLRAVGYGEAQPLASNDDEDEGRELNRRTEFKIISTDLSLAY